MHYPSINALRALEGLARHGTMHRTARELNLTPSAVSHQLKALERALGRKLVVRDGKGVALTPFALQYAGEIQKALAIIGHAHAHSEKNAPAGRLRLSCVSGFAVFWLCDQLNEFQKLYPEIELEISSPRRLDDVWDPTNDLFIAFGRGNWPGMYARLLTEIEFAPYCSPQFLRQQGEALTVSQLADLPLLHMGNYDDWSRWFSAAGSTIDSRRGIIFSNLHVVLSAAIAGLGVAIGDNLTCKAALGQGKLERPFDLSIRSLDSYYLVAQPDMMERPTCRAFHDWLVRKIAEEFPAPAH